jgi:hypothetical protein
MKLGRFLILILLITLFFSCSEKAADQKRTPILEVEGKFLYLDEIENIIPPNVNAKDSTEIADNFIRKWVTDVLIYENAKRNIINKKEIDQLLEEYKKSLTIQQYQQNLIEERLSKEPTEEEMKAFYEQYSEQLTLRYNIIKGILLIVPENAPKIANVRSWVQSGNTSALENIEKYSIQNAISYDYFGDKWIPLGDVLKKMPLQIEDVGSFLNGRHFIEMSDSTRHYFLKINSYKLSGQVEPFEMAKPKIASIILNKQKTEFISNFEDEIYNDAIKNGDITYFNKHN